MSSSIPSTCTTRLRKDFMILKKDPLPCIEATPLPNNILVWHYVVKGPELTPYHGGIYQGKLIFPKEYPFRPPTILMLTPNGRFITNERLCLSISDFHPDTWNPSWCVSSILNGLLSFMCETTPTTGSIQTTELEKRIYAQESLEYNLKDPLFCELFPEIAEEIRAKLRASQTDVDSTSNQHQQNNQNQLSNKRQTWYMIVLGNSFYIFGLAIFAFVVNFVINTVNN